MNKDLIQKAKQADILALVERHTQVKKVAQTNGGEYAGPCPACTGKDRFRVQPYAQGGGIWFCRICTGEKWKDTIEFLRFVSPGMGFRDAVNELNNIYPSNKREFHASPVVKSIINNPKWQQRARDLIAYAKKTLLEFDRKVSWKYVDPVSNEPYFVELSPLNYLKSRGLITSTIMKWDIGFIPKDLSDDPERWGLSGKKLFIPQGILIPCKIEMNTWYLKIRQPIRSPKYIQVRGSKAAPYMIETIKHFKNVIFCEGEFDALILWQEARSIIGIITLGGMSNKIDIGKWWQFLIPDKKFITAYDDDEPGRVGRDRLNIPISNHIDIPKIRTHTKDLTDYYLAGGDIRELVIKNRVDRSVPIG